MSVLAQNTAVVPDVEWSLLIPFLVLSFGGILLVTITSVVPRLRSGGFSAWFTMGLAVAAGLTSIPLWNRVSDDGPQEVVGRALAVDRFTVFVWVVIAIAVMLAAALLDGYLRRERLGASTEWYVLVLMSASGGLLMVASQELILTFLGLEILSIAVYVLAALHLRRSDSQEAAFKYFVLGALSSALFLYGIALVYGATGSTSLPDIAAARFANTANQLNPVEDSSLILAGMALILVGFAFKVAAVPFHMWTPDVYQGSPTPVVSFMASGVKVAGFAGLIRVFWQGFGFYAEDWRPILIVLSAASLLVGSFLALAQTNVKRMLAYSSIGHAGFILAGTQAVAVDDAATSALGAQALLFYLLTYTFTVAGTFGVMAVVGGEGDGAHSLDDYRGLSSARPVLAGLMAVLLFAQAGIPFTSGFFAKFRVILAAADSGSYVLAGIAVLSAVVAAVLYLRIVVSMFLTGAPAVAHATTATGHGGGEGAQVDGDGESVEDADGDGDGVEDADGDGDGEGVEDADGDLEIVGADRSAMPITWLTTAAIFVTAVVTIVLGVFPGIVDGVLRDAATTLVEFRS